MRFTRWKVASVALLMGAALGCDGGESLQSSHLPGLPFEVECLRPHASGACQNRIDMDLGMDGTPDLTGLLTYDELGQLADYTEVDASGCVVFQVERTFEDGRLVKQIHSGSQAAHPRTETIEYDDVERSESETTYDAGGVHVYSFYVDPKGRLSKRTWDDDGDGEVDGLEDILYEDGDPMVVHDLSDYHADGTIDFEYHSTYLEGRWLLSDKIVNAGVTQQTTSFTYDGAPPGTLSHIESSSPDNGVFALANVSYSDGQLSHVEFDVGADGTIQETSDLTYDSEGRIVKNVYASPNHDYFQATLTFEWQSGGPARMLETDPNGKPVVEYRFQKGCHADLPAPIARCPIGCALTQMNPLSVYSLDWQQRNKGPMKVDWIF